MTARFNDADAFVPLMPVVTSAGGTTARATLLPRDTVPGVAPAVGSVASSASGETPARAGARPPRVSVQRQGDVVTGIRIECACGHVIDLACVYPEPPPAQ